MSERRYPISAGDKVRHMDGRAGVVQRLAAVAGLPGAVVAFKMGDEAIPLGFLQKVGSLEID